MVVLSQRMEKSSGYRILLIMSDHEILLRLKRQYSQDEVVAWLAKELSERDIERGKQSSYIQELQEEVVKLKDKIGAVLAENKSLREEQQLKNKSKEIKELRQKVKDLVTELWQRKEQHLKNKNYGRKLGFC